MANLKTRKKLHRPFLCIERVLSMYTLNDKSVIEIEPSKENGEQEIGKQDKLLTTRFQMEIEN